MEGNTAIRQSYELERLLNRRKRRIRKKEVVEYLVRWKGYGAKHDKWLKQEKLGNAKKLLRNYHETTSSAPAIVPTLRLLKTSITEADTELRRRQRPKKA